MQYKNIPGTELNVSAICLGGADMGSTIEKELSFRLMDLFYEEGGNFIDTANVYANWLPVEKSISEKTIGRWLKERGLRNRIFIGTKGGHPELSTMHISRLSRNEIMHDLDESLTSLQTDYVDLYWLHRDDENRPVEEILETLNEQVQAGKIRSFGCSNWKAHRIQEAVQYTSKTKGKGFVGNQMMWSFAAINTDAVKDKTLHIMDRETMELHKKTKLAAIPYSSQASGFFTKLDNVDHIPLAEGIKRKYYNGENIHRLKRIKNVSNQLSVSISEVILGYLTSQPFTTIPIVGCKTIEQLKGSVKAGDLVLSEVMVNYLENGIGTAEIYNDMG